MATSTGVASPMLFTSKQGKTFEMEALEVPYILMTTLYRLQEEYESHDMPFTIEGVLRTALGLGIDTQRTRWKWAEINKGTKVIEKEVQSNLVSVLQQKDMSAEDRLQLVQEAIEEGQQKRAELRVKRFK
jgi:hypothetical protein